MSKPPAPEQKSLVGYSIGKCKLLRICGRGAMGTVYKGMHSGLDIEVAVKILPPHLANNSNLVERFLREAKLAARLNHINTVRVYDVGEESGYYYLIMEFIEGTDALQLLRKLGPQKAPIVADIGAGAARALDHAHASDVIHRDIKPANLMLPNSGGVKVADFGLARALSSESGLTMTGAIMGTPDYMAPEQAQGESVGALADVYALGATLYHLFVGRPPFQGSSPMAVALQHVTNRVVVPEEMVTDESSQQLTRLIHELTQKDPKQRPGKLDEITKRLAQIARGNRSTNKLLSEGATLYATAGLKLDADAINKAKEEAAAEALDKGRVQSPHLDRLRQAAEKARSGMHAAVPEKPAKPQQAPAEMAELTGDMVREARARARRSSGQIKALPQDIDKSTRRTSNPAMSPHRDQRPTSSSSSRRSKIVQNPEVDDEAWQSYAAKSFPTFERKSIVDGSVPDEIVAERQSGSGIRSGSSSGVDFSKPMGAQTSYDDWQPPKHKKSGGVGASLLVALLIIAGIAVGIWWFYLRAPGGGGGQQGPTTTMLTVSKFQAHTRNTSVTVIVPQTGGPGFYTGGEDGVVARWIPGQKEPAAKTPLPHGTVTALALRDDGNRLVVGTDKGVVLLLDSNSLNISSGRELSVDARVTAVLTLGLGQLLVGDNQGRLTLKGATKRVKVDPEGSAVTGLVKHGSEIWAAAGNTIAIYRIEANELVEVSSYPSLPGELHNLMKVGEAVYGVIDKKLQRITNQGAVEGGFDVRYRSFTGTHNGVYLAGTGAGGIVVLNPETLEVVAANPLDKNITIMSVGASTQPGRFYLGTRTGELYQCTIQ